MLDLRKPHGAYVAQGIGISQREAKHHYVRPTGNGGREKVFFSCTYIITEIIDKIGKRWQRRADLLCHEQEMSAERRHLVFDGVKGTEGSERKKGSVLSHRTSCQFMLKHV